ASAEPHTGQAARVYVVVMPLGGALGVPAETGDERDRRNGYLLPVRRAPPCMPGVSPSPAGRTSFLKRCRIRPSSASCPANITLSRRGGGHARCVQAGSAAGIAVARAAARFRCGGSSHAGAGHRRERGGPDGHTRGAVEGPALSG